VTTSCTKPPLSFAPRRATSTIKSHITVVATATAARTVTGIPDFPCATESVMTPVIVLGLVVGCLGEGSDLRIGQPFGRAVRILALGVVVQDEHRKSRFLSGLGGGKRITLSQGSRIIHGIWIAALPAQVRRVSRDCGRSLSDWHRKRCCTLAARPRRLGLELLH
jgi:hypothetical protein